MPDPFYKWWNKKVGQKRVEGRIAENNKKPGIWKEKAERTFPGGPVVKKPPSNAGDGSSIPPLGTDILHAMEQIKPTQHNWREAFTATKSLHPATKTPNDATKTWRCQK